jgi:hypothetical protein
LPYHVTKKGRLYAKEKKKEQEEFTPVKEERYFVLGGLPSFRDPKGPVEFATLPTALLRGKQLTH